MSRSRSYGLSTCTQPWLHHFPVMTPTSTVPWLLRPCGEITQSKSQQRVRHNSSHSYSRRKMGLVRWSRGPRPFLATQWLQGQPKTSVSTSQKKTRELGKEGAPFLTTTAPALPESHGSGAPHLCATNSAPRWQSCKVGPVAGAMHVSVLSLLGQPPNTDTRQLIESQNRVGKGENYTGGTKEKEIKSIW